jgi:aryl-alcohol dehydrogenase-like predicted oxidoreductase
MQTRTLGRTGLTVSILGLGCGAVGGLMVRGDPADRERVVARALEAGITYFDTAPAYGDGQSEINLGVVLAKLKPELQLGTKLRLKAEDKGDIAAAVIAGIEASLQRLGREQLDLYQLHNAITQKGEGGALTARMVLEDVVPAFEKLRAQGKTRFIGITAVGETPELHAIAASGAFDTAQVCHNLLNPSVATKVPGDFAGQDYDCLLDAMRAAGMGAIGIRALAGGALSGSAQRHPIASAPPEPIGSGADYNADVASAQKFRFLVDQGYAATMPEAAVRFATGNAGIATTLIGIATVAEFEAALAAVAKGTLPPAALERITAATHAPARSRA